MRVEPAVFVVLLALACRGASAEDQPFLTLDTTDIEPQFAHEFEQNFAWAIGSVPGDALHAESELEYGLYENLQLAGELDYGWSRSGPGEPVFRFTSAGGEAIDRLTNVDFDPLGLAVLVSGSAGPDLREIEGRLIAQKNFLNDRLRVVLNGGWTGDWEHDVDSAQSQWKRDSALEWAAGIAYSITWEWSACLELDGDHGFEGTSSREAGRASYSTYYFGPTLQYVAHPLTVSLGFQAQLPWAEGGAPGVVQNGFASDAERYRVALRVTQSF